MKKVNRIVMLMLAVVLLIPSVAFAQEVDFENFSDYEIQLIKKQIAETIDYSDSELYPSDSPVTYSMYSPMATSTSADFAIYHRSEEKLSMSDDAFDKSKSTIVDTGDAYEITLYTQPIGKDMFGKTYYADCTSITPNIKGKTIEVEKFGSKKAVNNPDKTVPEGFKFTISKSDLSVKDVGDYQNYFRIKFTTNLSDSGFLGKIGAAMMNPNARFFIK